MKDGVCESCVCVSKGACDKVVCERWSVTVCVCVTDGVSKMVCETKWCVKGGVSKMVCDKAACERWRVKDGV